MVIAPNALTSSPLGYVRKCKLLRQIPASPLFARPPCCALTCARMLRSSWKSTGFGEVKIEAGFFLASPDAFVLVGYSMKSHSFDPGLAPDVITAGFRRLEGR